ncbi:MAG: hypothetical protein ABGY05_14930, partial [Pseudomonadota bacterium]
MATEAHIARIGDFEEDLTAVCFQLFDETLALSDPYHQRMIVSTKTERCYRIAAVFLNVVRDRMACMSVERIDIAALHSLREYEDAEFVRRRPRSRELLERGRASMPGGVPMSWMTGLYEHVTIFPVAGDGAYFEDVDGHRYLDMNQVDIAGFLGFAPAPVTEALSAQAARGSSFLLPPEDSIAVAENLAERVGLPFWQFTGAASNSNA